MQRMRFGDLDVSVIDPHERDTRYIYDEIFTSQFYYHPDQRMPRHPLVIDVGANIGLYSIWAHRRYQPRAIHAYEASPQTYRYLVDNTARLIDGEITTIHAVNRPLARTVGETLVLHQSPLISGLSTLLDGDKVGWVKELTDSREIVTHRVVTSTLSAELERENITGDIDMLKIDVEGYFMEVLGGIAPADFARIRNIVIEVDYGPQVGVTIDSITEFMRTRGYRTAIEDLMFFAWRG